MALVKAASWDISLGLASRSLGRLILNATSESDELAPDAMDHVGLKIFGNLYEYGDLGILKTEIPEEKGDKLKSKYPAFSLRNVEELGYTDRSQEEFEEWVEEMNNGDFQGCNYDVVNNSCKICNTKPLLHPVELKVKRMYRKIKPKKTVKTDKEGQNNDQASLPDSHSSHTDTNTGDETSSSENDDNHSRAKEAHQTK